jgi:hypothetical protein
MLAKGDRVMVLSRAPFATGRLGTVKWFNSDDEVGVAIDFYNNRTLGFARQELAQLPLPKEVRHAE